MNYFQSPQKKILRQGLHEIYNKKLPSSKLTIETLEKSVRYVQS